MLGEVVRRPTKLDKKIIRELKALSTVDDPYETVVGTTMCAEDFYEGDYKVFWAFSLFLSRDRLSQ